MLMVRKILQRSVQKRNSKIIFTGSVAVYGFAAPGTNENGGINPFNEYEDKFAAEKIALMLCEIIR